MAFPPLQLAFYKGSFRSSKPKWGALQLTPQKPHFYPLVKGSRESIKLRNFEGRFIPASWKEKYPDLSVKDLVSREGALFVEIAGAIGKDSYDWDNKIVFALSIHDLGKVLTFLESGKTIQSDGSESDELDIMHDPGAKSVTAGKIIKRFKISSPKGIRTGVLISLTQSGTNKETTSYTVPLSGSETKLLSAAVRGFIPAALGWS